MEESNNQPQCHNYGGVLKERVRYTRTSLSLELPPLDVRSPAKSETRYLVLNLDHPQRMWRHAPSFIKHACDVSCVWLPGWLADIGLQFDVAI